MVNMNKYKDPAVYGLVDPDGGVFYVGRTKTNAQNRLWEHIYRARIGHTAPVYVKMREVGFEKVTVVILHRLSDNEDAALVEAEWIKKLLDAGVNLVNAFGRDGVPNSWSEETRKRGMPSKRGKPTWIKGKTGEAAGWTEERRAKQSQRFKEMNERKSVLE